MDILALSNVSYVPKKQSWPGITKDIEGMVQNCETCLKFSANNCKPKPENTLGHEVPSISWTKFGMDIFTFDSENCLLVVAYTSKFPIICKLPSMTARVVMEIMKSIISEEGYLATIVSDNGPFYASEYFRQEMQKYKHSAITASPHYPQSNRFAEVCQNLQGTDRKCRSTAFSNNNFTSLPLEQ